MKHVIVNFDERHVLHESVLQLFTGFHWFPHPFSWKPNNYKESSQSVHLHFNTVATQLRPFGFSSPGLSTEAPVNIVAPVRLLRTSVNAVQSRRTRRVSSISSFVLVSSHKFLQPVKMPGETAVENQPGEPQQIISKKVGAHN